MSIPPYCYVWRPHFSSLSIRIYTIAELLGFRQQTGLSFRGHVLIDGAIVKAWYK